MQKIAIYAEKSSYYLLILFTLLLPLSRASNTIFSIYFTLYFFIYIAFHFKDCKIFRDRFFIITTIFILYTLASIGWNGINGYQLGDATHYLQWIAIFGVAIFVTNHRDSVNSIISAFLIGMLISEILSYGMYFGLWEINGKGASEPTPFMMHIDYSVYIAVAALILLNRVFSDRYNLKVRIIMAIFFITMSGNLFINGGRTGQVAFIIAIFVAFFLHFKFTIKNLLYAFAIVSLILTIAFYSSNKFQTKLKSASSDIQLLSKNDYESSWGRRVGMFKIAPDLIKEAPIFGSGINSQKEVVSKFINENNPSYFIKPTKEFLKKNHLHNQFLQTIVELGIVGLILLFTIFYTIFKFKILNKEFKELKYIFLTIFIIGCMPEPLFLKQFTNMLFILFIGILFGLHLNNKEKKCIN